MSRTITVGLMLVLSIGCGNAPERPIVPIDPAMTSEVYMTALTEVKRLLTPAAGAKPAINWSERMYLNPVILLPPADSANPLDHDVNWMADAQVRGLVRGTCGQPPANPCPDSIAFTSLGVPWTRGGDSSFVLAGYVEEMPGDAINNGVFWLMTITHNEDRVLKVTAKGPPNYVTFNARKK
ncbi:MAG: hypothetical protein ABI679_09335 [Gemmatimonadota bacterium]